MSLPLPQDPQTTELLKMLLSLYARQMATLRLLEKSGVSPQDIDAALEEAELRLHKIPIVAEALSRKNLSQIQALVRTVESVPWNRWD
jgi:hypothetical protein